MKEFFNTINATYIAILCAGLVVVPASFVAADDLALMAETTLPALPEAVSNNAVVSIQAQSGNYLVSFSGLAPGKSHDDTHARTFLFDVATEEWSEAGAVPGGDGRLASVAVAVGPLAYVFGGYTVGDDGSEVSLPYVHAFDPIRKTFEARAQMPVPVDDAVAISYANRYIYLISGWHDFGNVNLVQRYDTMTDSWAQATPIPGPAVFGHAGGIVDDRIVYCDGVAVQAQSDKRRDFVAVGDCYLGIIDETDSRRIDWRTISPHPGKPRYRMAAAGTAVGVMFVGGSANPYNYDGIGYDGEPSQPESGAFLYVPLSGKWHELSTDGEATMDHRGLVFLGSRWLTIGGMLNNQQITDRVYSYSLRPVPQESTP